ncbi:MAG: RHS repeat domain-containing protein [Aridibacter sp.]
MTQAKLTLIKNTKDFNGSVKTKEHKNTFCSIQAALQMLTGLALVLILTFGTFAQDKAHTDNSAEQTLRSSGRVNPSTFGLEMNIPLGAYPGRGINVPVSINYSSKVWRLDFNMYEPANPGCSSLWDPVYSENSASGWTSSLGVAYVEYTGKDNLFDQNGFPVSDLCDQNDTQYQNYGYIKRIQIHLPSGESHELRASDNPVIYPTNSSPNFDFTGMFYAVDGSKMKYDGSINRLYLPDGSTYDFGGEITQNNKKIRKATLYKDINGNQLTFNAPNATHQYGSWTDTVGRTIPVPMPLESPTTLPTGPVDYNMPGFNGGTMTYKFHWKQLKGSSAATSGLTNFSDSLRYKGDYPGFGQSLRSSSTALFHTVFRNKALDYASNPVFNPVVMTAVELPDGRMYEFSYNVYGEIDHIKYPTEGEEDFSYQNFTPVSGVTGSGLHVEANRGVQQRDVKESSGATPYSWTYTAGASLRTITSPDGTKVERKIYTGDTGCSGFQYGSWGFEPILAGMAYEENSYAGTGHLIGKQKTTWTNTTLTSSSGTCVSPQWHPRVTKVESIIYDLSGNYVSKSSTMDYAGNLNDITNSVDVYLTKEYGFTTSIGGLGALQRQTEITYLEYDTSISQATRDAYKAKQLISLPSKTYVKNPAGTVVAKSEVYYDEAGYSGAYLANPTRMKSWLDTSNSWIESRAKYDSYGRVTEATDPKGNISTTEYSATYNYAYPTKVATAVPDPSNTNGSNTAFYTTTTYDMTTGLPLTSTDANGQTTSIEYNDALLRPTKVTPPTGGGITETEYGAGTNSATRYTKVRTQIDATNWSEAYSYYDGLGRTFKTEQIDSNGNIYTDKEFDAEGRVKRVTNPYRTGETPQWTTNVYDVVGRVKEVITPDGAKVLTSYDIANAGSYLGTSVTVTDQAGKQRRSVTNALGQLTRVDEPTTSGLGTVASPTQATNYSYDTLNNLTTVSQGVQTRTFSYNSLSRLLNATNPEAGTISYVYDNSGNLTSKTDARNVVTSYAYDNLNRVTQRSYSDATPQVSYYYDNQTYAKGLLTKVSSSISQTEYTGFDNTGRALSHRQTIDGTAYTTAYTYNLAGMLLEETYPSGRVVKNTLDADGALSKVETKTAAGANETRADNFTYTSHGAASSIRLGNNRWESMQFNSRLQPTQIALGTTQNNTDLLKLDYTYGTTNNNGNVLSQAITVPTAGGSAGFTATQNYNYDSLNRIKDAQETVSGVQTWKQTFVYDRYGNRNFDAANTTTIAGCPANQCNPTINQANNRFNSGQGYSYDLSGNIISDAEGRTFIYDAENKQKEVKNSSNVTVGTYFYDGDGKRIKKVTASEEIVFVYDAGGKLVAEYSSQTPQTTATTRYLTSDHLGSPRIITDGSGNVLSRRDFLPFGEELYTGTGNRQTGHGYTYGDSTRQKFTGYQRDEETDLDFAQARMYSSQLGRFTAVDPLLVSGNSANPQTFNRYAYVMNSPLLFTDPTGLMGEYWDRNGHYLGMDEDGKDGLTYLADVTERTDDGYYVNNIVATPYLDILRLRSATSSQSASGRTNIQALLSGFSEGYNDTITGAGKGGANFLINSSNLLTQPFGPAGAAIGIPNPFRIEPYTFDSLRQARVGSGVEIGSGLGVGAAFGVFSGGSSALSVVPRGSSFFQGTRYTDKVLGQMKTGDFHAFPESVRAFESAGRVTNITGGDGVVRQMLRIPGGYRNSNGFFEFIKEQNGNINHRFFNTR